MYKHWHLEFKVLVVKVDVHYSLAEAGWPHYPTLFPTPAAARTRRQQLASSPSSTTQSVSKQ
jgi:hypothetical protein